MIRSFIGHGGKKPIKSVKALTGVTDVSVEIVDGDGIIRITADCPNNARRAIEFVRDMFREVEIGHTFQAPVVSIIESGCFVRVTEVKDCLVHISELADARVARVEDVVKVHDVIWVKCIGVDKSGRVRLSRKAAMRERELGGGA
jgi:polyribonucleotide nucleotidyltransferase